MEKINNNILRNKNLLIKRIKNYFRLALFNELSPKKEIQLRYGLVQFEEIKGLFIAKNDVYRLLFFYFYQLNKGFPISAFDDFFNLLNKGTSEEELFNSSIQLLGKKSSKYHLSFSTKLVNLEYENFPIIDKHVKRFFGIKTYQKLSFEQLIYIKTFYVSSVIPNVHNELLEFKKKFSLKLISDVKIIDFLIWINKGA